MTRLRSDLAFIAHWIPKGSHVLDLGCGDGTLLAHLQNVRQCTGYGIEIADSKVAACVAKGVPVIQQNLETGLSMFGDGQFDTVVQLQTLQAMVHVEPILREIARVGRQAIISFPNFAYWHHRWQLALGRMPVSKSLPHQWFDTPNLRCATIEDFKQLADDVGLSVLDCVALHEGQLIRWLPNLRGSLAVFRLARR